MTSVERVITVLMLGAAIWALLFLLPKAARERDRFAIVCAVLTALTGFLGWLLLGVGVLSR